MTNKTAVVNYTPEQTVQVVALYQSGIAVEQIALDMGKSVRSIVAKLSREKVYVAKVATSKSGEPVVKKDMVADAIASLVNLSESEAESLTKANKTALQKIFECLNSMEFNR
jgi:hypothetical protein